MFSDLDNIQILENLKSFRGLGVLRLVMGTRTEGI